jgi:hypothetical protein
LSGGPSKGFEVRPEQPTPKEHCASRHFVLYWSGALLYFESEGAYDAGKKALGAVQVERGRTVVARKEAPQEGFTITTADGLVRLPRRRPALGSDVRAVD